LTPGPDTRRPPVTRVAEPPIAPQTGRVMKQDIHPNYRPVVFQDLSEGTNFVIRSTVETDDMITLDDGVEYPLVKVEISSASHPFFTGTMKIVDTAGRVERFERRYGQRRKG